MKKTLVSFVVAGALTIGNISAVASEYITNTVDVITQIDSKEKIKRNPLQIAKYIELLEQSDKEFQDKVIPFMLDNYKKVNSQDFGGTLGNIALTIKDKDSRYDAMIKLFKKDKDLISYNKKIIQLKNNNKIIKEKIQEIINLVFLHIEAKNTFLIAEAVLKNEKINDITLKDYWYTKDFEDNDKALFISIEQENDINLDSIYALEDATNEYIMKTTEIKKETSTKLGLGNNPKVDEYSFNVMSKNFFKRVSIM
jgi:hypothetical protein